MILITIQFQRFVYFSTVNIVLLSAICITEPFTWKRADGTSLSLRALASSSFLSSLLKIQTGTIRTEKTPAPKNREKAESH